MADIAIVTGGTGSIGTAVCEALSASGFVCLAADLVEPAGDSPREFQRLDVASHASIGDLLDFFARLPNPDKQFTVMPGIAHASFQQKNHEMVYDILHGFFARTDPVYRG